MTKNIELTNPSKKAGSVNLDFGCVNPGGVQAFS